MKKTSQYEILIINVDPGSLTSLKEQLEKTGYRCDIAISVKTAQKNIIEKTYGLLILNTDKLGNEIAEFAKAKLNTCETPILFISNETVKKEFVLKWSKTGVSDFLVKPFDATLLNLKVKNLLQIFHLENELNTAKKTIEKKAVRAAISYQDLYLSLPNEVILIDHKGIIISVNRSEALDSGITIKELLNKHYSKIPFLKEILTSDDDEKKTKHLLELTEDITDKEFEIKKTDGTSYFGEASSTLAVINGKFHLQLTLVDISEKKKTEKELSTSYREILYAEKINKSVLTGGSLAEVSQLFLQSLEEITDGRASRVYTYSSNLQKLNLLAQNVEGGILSIIENKIGIKINTLCPPAESGSFFGDLINNKLPVITSDRNKIKKILESHTHNPFLKSISGWIVDILKIKTICVIPLISKKEVVGILTVSVKRILSDSESQLILRLTELYSLVFEKSHSELELKKSQDRYKSLFNNMNEGIVFSGGDQIIKMVNPAFCKMVGYSESELIGVNGYKLLLDTSDRAEITAKISNRIKGKSESYEMQMITRAGNKIITYNSAFPVFNSSGVFEGIMSVITDITIRKKYELEINLAKNKFESVLNHINDGLFQDSLDGKIIFYNKKFLEIFGLKESDIPNIAIESFAAPEYHAEIRERHNKRIAGENVPELIEYVGLRKDGTRIWIEARVSAIAENGKITGTQSVIRDITERKIRNEELKKTVIELNNRNNELMQFNYIVSHNLRAPIVSIIGLGDVYNLPNISNEERTQITEHIQSSIRKMDDLVKDLTQVLATRSALNTKREWVDIEKLLISIKDTLADEITQTNTSLIANFSENADEIFTIKSYLESILYNLICNGIKYKSSQRNPAIHISVSKNINKTTIAVSDNGIGIDMEKYGSQLFGLYKRFHLEVEGKGLGLHMVKTQVEALSGEIKVESRLGFGTIFTITLPLQQSNG